MKFQICQTVKVVPRLSQNYAPRFQKELFISKRSPWGDLRVSRLTKTGREEVLGWFTDKELYPTGFEKKSFEEFL